MVTNLTANAADLRDVGLIPESGRYPGEGNGKYSCLENTTDRGAWWATVLGVAKMSTTEHTHTLDNLPSTFCFAKLKCINASSAED